MIQINYVKRFYKNHRTIVSVTVFPHWFLRIFLWAKPKEYAFIAHGTDWVQFFEDEDEGFKKELPKLPTTTTK